MTIEHQINTLLKKGVRKVDIQKACDVNWVTVHYWSKGIFKPQNKKHIETIEQLYKGLTHEKQS